MLGPALATFALTRIPKTDNARMKTRNGLSSLISESLNDFALRTHVGSNSPQIHRRETGPSGGDQIKGKLRLRPGATVIRIACSLSRIDCYTAFALRLPSKARRGQSACPTSALGPFPDFSASRTMCALRQQTPSECSTCERARSGLCKQNGRPGQSAAWSDIPVKRPATAFTLAVSTRRQSSRPRPYSSGP